MTSSAATRRPAGGFKPRALAVFMLRMVSYFVGVCTGRSEGLAPRRISIDVICRLPIVVSSDDPVGHETTCVNHELKSIHRRQAMSGREGNDEIGFDASRAFWQHNHRAVWVTGDSSNYAINVGVSVLDLSTGRFDSERWCGGFRRAHQIIIIYGSFRISQQRHTCCLWRDLLEHAHPFSNHAWLIGHESGDIAARTSKARDEACADRIDDVTEHDRYSAGLIPQRGGGRPRLREYDLRLRRYQFPGKHLDLSCARRNAMVDMNITALGPSAPFEFLLERLYVGIVIGREHADAPSPVGIGSFHR